MVCFYFLVWSLSRLLCCVVLCRFWLQCSELSLYLIHYCTYRHKNGLFTEDTNKMADCGYLVQRQDQRLAVDYCRHASTGWACRNMYCRHASTCWACRHMYCRHASTGWACRHMYCRHASTGWECRHMYCKHASTGWACRHVYCRHASTGWACRNMYCRDPSIGWACRHMYCRRASTGWACRHMYCRHASTGWACRHMYCRHATYRHHVPQTLTYMDWPFTAPSAHYRPLTHIDTPFCDSNKNRLTYCAMRIN